MSELSKLSDPSELSERSEVSEWIGAVRAIREVGGCRSGLGLSALSEGTTACGCLG